jgi:hypothetical protein
MPTPTPTPKPKPNLKLFKYVSIWGATSKDKISEISEIQINCDNKNVPDNELNLSDNVYTNSDKIGFFFVAIPQCYKVTVTISLKKKSKGAEFIVQLYDYYQSLDFSKEDVKKKGFTLPSPIHTAKLSWDNDQKSVSEIFEYDKIDATSDLRSNVKHDYGYVKYVSIEGQKELNLVQVVITDVFDSNIALNSAVVLSSDSDDLVTSAESLNYEDRDKKYSDYVISGIVPPKPLLSRINSFKYKSDTTQSSKFVIQLKYCSAIKCVTLYGLSGKLSLNGFTLKLWDKFKSVIVSKSLNSETIQEVNITGKALYLLVPNSSLYPDQLMAKSGIDSREQECVTESLNLLMKGQDYTQNLKDKRETRFETARAKRRIVLEDENKNKKDKTRIVEEALQTWEEKWRKDNQNESSDPNYLSNDVEFGKKIDHAKCCIAVKDWTKPYDIGTGKTRMVAHLLSNACWAEILQNSTPVPTTPAPTTPAPTTPAPTTPAPAANPTIYTKTDFASNQTATGSSNQTATGSSNQTATGSSNQTAGSSNQTAGSSNQTAGSSNQATGSSNQTAGSSNQTAASSNQTTASSNQATGSSNQTAGSSNQTATGSSNQTAGSSNQTATDSNQTAGSSNQTATDSNQTAGSSNQTAGSSNQATGSSNQATGSSNQTAQTKDDDDGDGSDVTNNDTDESNNGDTTNNDTDENDDSDVQNNSVEDENDDGDVAAQNSTDINVAAAAPAAAAAPSPVDANPINNAKTFVVLWFKDMTPAKWGIIFAIFTCIVLVIVMLMRKKKTVIVVNNSLPGSK